MSHNPYKLKLFMPVSLAIIAAASFLIIIVLYLQYMAVEERKMTNIPNFETEFSTRLEKRSKDFDAIINFLKKDEKLQEDFMNADRENLYQKSLPIYEDLYEKMSVTHFYFLDTQGRILLRVHDRDRYGDLAERITFRGAQRTQKPFSGIEFGIKKNFTLRNVHPWFIDGKLAGYIELGKEIDKIMSDIAHLMDVQIYMAVDKEYYSKISPLISKEMQTYYQSENFYVVYNTAPVPEEMEMLLNSDIHADLHIHMLDKYYHTLALPLKDISQEKLGYFIFLVDATFERTLFFRIVIILFISIGLFTLLLIYMWRVLGQKRENQINLMTESLARLAVTDELSGLYNRKHFNEQVPLELSRIKREKMSLSMLMMDIDFFKRYNDTYGHQAGDEAIKKVSFLMKQSFRRASDLCFRIGGEEFAITVTHKAHENILERANAFCKTIAEAGIEHKGNEASNLLTVSIGIATCKETDPCAIETLYKHSDEALYRAKEEGRNRVVTYETTKEKTADES